MCRLIDAIDAQASAADQLTHACMSNGAIADEVIVPPNPFVTTLKRQFRAAAITPTDMLIVLGKLK